MRCRGSRRRSPFSAVPGAGRENSRTILRSHRQSRRGGRVHVVTGGGPGVMEAAFKGAIAAAQNGGAEHRVAHGAATESVRHDFPALPLLLRQEGHARQIRHSLRAPARGFGTVDELFETVTLIQTHKIRPFRSSSWAELLGGLLDWLRSRALRRGSSHERSGLFQRHGPTRRGGGPDHGLLPGGTWT